MRTVTSPHRKRSQAIHRRREEQRWAKRSGTVFTYFVDPKQLRSEQLARALDADPELFERLTPEMKQLIRLSCGDDAVPPPSA